VQTGEVIDRKYEIVRALGQGGMGAVYEARHIGTGRRVAVKVILNNAQDRKAEAHARFQREAKAAGAIESMHIAQVLDTGVDAQAGHPYLVMEYLSGDNLQSLLERAGPLHPDLAMRIVAQACLGLQKAHEAGIVHRDVKPANIFLARHPDAGQVIVKLLDFGIAKDTTAQPHGSLTVTGAVLGSPYYMSPEQAMGEKGIDHRTDIWSLGIVLYEALAGRTPFADRETLGTLILAIHSNAPAPVQQHAPHVPAELAAIVHRALARSPSDRFSSVAQMFAGLRALLPNGYSIHDSVLENDTSLGPSARVSALPASGGPASTATFMSASGSALTPSLRSSTNAGVQSPSLGFARPSRSKGLVWGVGSLLAIIAIGTGATVTLRGRGATPPVAAGVSAVVSSASSTPVAPVAPSASNAPVAPAETLSTAEAPEATPPTPAPLTRAPAANARPLPPPVARPVVHAGAPVAPHTDSTCNPNFYVDAKGQKRFKPECFSQ
jgi:serine/threonine-protein kinase